jgi:hypothetical protein
VKAAQSMRFRPGTIWTRKGHAPMTALELKRHRAVEILLSNHDILKNLSEANLYDCERPKLRDVRIAAHYLKDLGLDADAIQFAQAMNELCLHWHEITAYSGNWSPSQLQKLGLPEKDCIGKELRITALMGSAAQINAHLDKILKHLNVSLNVETWRVVGVAPQLEVLFDQIEKHGRDEGDCIAIETYNLKSAIKKVDGTTAEPAQILRNNKKAHGKHISKWLDTSTRGVIRLRKQPKATEQKFRKNTAKAQ